VKELIKGLAKINCEYLHSAELDGKCYSKDCMFNGDKKVSSEIAKNGCLLYKKFKNGDIK